MLIPKYFLLKNIIQYKPHNQTCKNENIHKTISQMSNSEPTHAVILQ